MFGDKLKELRTARNLSQNELGELVGVSGRVIGFYETNNRFPKEERVLLNIAKLFNVSLDYLLDNSFNPKKRDDAALEIYKIFRDKGLIVEGEEITDEMLESISSLLDTAIKNAEQINKISKKSK